MRAHVSVEPYFILLEVRVFVLRVPIPDVLMGVCGGSTARNNLRVWRSYEICASWLAVPHERAEYVSYICVRKEEIAM